jgi:hypothetical protein
MPTYKAKEGNAIEKARGWYLIALKYNGIRAIQYLDSAVVKFKIGMIPISCLPCPKAYKMKKSLDLERH